MPNKKRGREAEAPKTAKKAKLRIDELQWKEVKMPDRLDDVEGFFGLEEIDGVDVVANEKGAVEFQLRGKKPVKKTKKSKPARKVAAAPEDGDDNDGSEDEAEEWGGISDAEQEVTEGEAQTAQYEKKEPKKGDKKKNDAKAKDKKAQRLVAKGKLENQFGSLLEDRPDESDEEDVDLPEWEALNLSPPTLRALSKLKFASPTPIQSAAIPHILAGHDVIGKASTGSGKTLAFGIPILETFLKSGAASTELVNADQKKRTVRLPMALVLSPTRELAKQLSDHLRELAVCVPDFTVVTLTGGLSLQKQQRQLEQGTGADVIVATPGRLWEVVSEGTGWMEKLKQGLKFLVVDEADRLLQEGHYKEVEELLDLLQRERDESEIDGEEEAENEDLDAAEFQRKKPSKKKLPTPKRQTLVFSATFHQGLQQKLTAKPGKKSWATESAGGDLMDNTESLAYLLKKLNFREATPKFVDANPVGQMASRLREGIIECGAMEKDLYLYYLLLRYPCRTLVFTNSISSVKRLAPFLSELNLPVNPLHSNMIQKARMRNLERFSSPSSPNSILIATDVAARGLDIKGVEMVIHYHLPRTADMYVHRSGRTARSDARGISILLCSPEEVLGVRRLVGKVHEEDGKSTGKYAMKSFDVDRKLVDRLKRRATLAKKVSDSTVEKAKKSKENDWLKTAADELGVDYDSDEFSNLKVGKKGQRGKVKREKAANVSKADVGAWKAELRELLKLKINSGFSERYLTSGAVNIAKSLLDGVQMHDSILGVEKKSVIDEVTW